MTGQLHVQLYCYSNGNTQSVSITPFCSGYVNFENVDDLRAHLTNGSWIIVTPPTLPPSSIKSGLREAYPFHIRCTAIAAFSECRV